MLKNGLIRSIFVLASGTALAQVINLGFIPLITRLYGPEAYGMMGSFMSIVNILIPLCAFSYPIAVVLPKGNRMAAELVRLCLLLGLVVALVSGFLLLLSLLFFREQVSGSKYPSWYLLLLPAMLMTLPFQQVGQQWLIRTRNYSQIARISVIQAGVVNILRVIGGVIAPVPLMLVLITALGYALQAFQLFYSSLRKGLKLSWTLFNFRNIKCVARRYYDFPVYRTPQVLINSLSQGLPIFIIAWFFGPVDAGFYSLAQTMLGAPITLLSGAISNVYYPRVNEKVNNSQPIFYFLSKSIIMLMAFSVIIYSVVILFGPSLFSFIFGDKWQTAGEIGRWMALYCIFWLSSRPAIDSVPSLKIQHFFLIYEIISMVFKFLSLIAGAMLIKSSLGAMVLFSLVNAISYISLSVMVILVARKSDMRIVN